MKNKKTKILGLGVALLGAILLSSCTANFCNNQDTAEILYPYDQGVTIYSEYEDIKDKPEILAIATKALPGNDKIYKYVPVTLNPETLEVLSYDALKASYLQNIINVCLSNGYSVPSQVYFETIDDLVLKATILKANGYGDETLYSVHAIEDAFAHPTATLSEFIANLTTNDASDGKWCINPYIEDDANGGEGTTPIPLQENGGSLLRTYGSIKFLGSAESGYESFGFIQSWIQTLKYSDIPGLGYDGCPSTDFMTYYIQQMSSTTANLRSCIATRDYSYGHYGSNYDWEVKLTQKDWGYAWGKGFLEGLLVFPVAWLVDTFAFGMDANLAGWSQLLAIVFVTIIVRGIMMLATFRTTLGQQKMQALQPQLAKLQQKYPNSNTNAAEKQRLAQEQMMLYKRNKINPIGSLIVMIFQFPIFICVWSALQGSAALSSGEFLHLRLSDTIKDTLFRTTGSWYANSTGWWTALALFLLMAGAQIFSMLLPQLIAKKNNKKIVKTTANPAADKTGKQTKIMMWAMMIMTIVMGFFLPSAMGVYWLIGALISMAQTGITQLVIHNQNKR